MGALDDLMGAGRDFLDKRYADNEKFRESFKANPVGHIAQDALTGLMAMGNPAGMAKPVPFPRGGAAPPPGNYFRPPAPESMPGANPVSGMKTYAEMMPAMDPKMLAARYQRMFPDTYSAQARLDALPEPGNQAGALMRRNQSLIDLMSNPDANGPWGARP